MWKGSENTKRTKRLATEEIKKQLINSLVNSDAIETDELNEEVDTVKKPEDAADIIKKYEEILRTKRKGIMSVVYHQGKMFSRFHEKEKFVRFVGDFGVHKNTIIFKINILKLIDQHPKSVKSSVTLSFLKDIKDIKQTCQENSSEFE